MLRALEDGGVLHQVVEPLERALGLRATFDRAGDERPALGDGLQTELDVELRGEEVPAPALVEVDLPNDQHRLADMAAHQEIRLRGPHLPAGAGREPAAV